MSRPLTTDLPFEQQPISEQFRVIAKAWVDADAAAALMEELKTTTLEKIKAGIVNCEQGIPDNAATRMAKCCPEWNDYVKTMCENRAKANKLKVQMEYLKMRHREWIGKNADARAERRL